MGTKLKPCPFCDSTDLQQAVGTECECIRCNNCGAEGPPSSTEAGAIISWNRRSTDNELTIELKNTFTDLAARQTSLDPDILAILNQLVPDSEDQSCPTCGATNPDENEWCSNGFHVQPREGS